MSKSLLGILEFGQNIRGPFKYPNPGREGSERERERERGKIK